MNSFDKLNDLWKRANEELRKYPVLHDVEIEFVEHGEAITFGYGKKDGAWTAYINHGQPIDSASLKYRTCCVLRFRQLRQKVIEASEEALVEVQRSVEDFEKILERL